MGRSGDDDRASRDDETVDSETDPPETDAVEKTNRRDETDQTAPEQTPVQSRETTENEADSRRETNAPVAERIGTLPTHPPGPPTPHAIQQSRVATESPVTDTHDGKPTPPIPGQGRQSLQAGASEKPRDPVQETFGGRVDLYEIATWEVRTSLDAFAVRLTNSLESTKRWLLLTLAIALFLGQLVFATALIIETPLLGVLGVLSALPALLLAGYFWYGDPTTREPLLTLAVTFLLAIAFASIAGVVNSFTVPFFEVFGILGMTLFYFLIVGPIEETVKWLAVRVYAFRTDAFRTVVDGVVYGAMAGVGFAAIENLLYIILFSVETTASGVFIQQEEAIAIATQRAFVGPGHVIFSAWAGFYLGLAKFNYSKRGPIVVKGLLIAAFIHGLYNTLVTSLPLTLGSFLAFIVIFHGFWFLLLYRKIRAYRELYKQRPLPGPDW